MKGTNKWDITEELLCEMGYRFPDRFALEAFLSFANAVWREHVVKELMESLTDAQKDALGANAASESDLIPRLLSMVQSDEALPQVEIVVEWAWLSFCKELRSQKEHVMKKLHAPLMRPQDNRQNLKIPSQDNACRIIYTESAKQSSSQ